MQIRMIALAIGLAAVTLLPELNPAMALATALACIICAGFNCRYPALTLLTCLLAGASWSMCYGLRVLDVQMPRQLEQQPLWVLGEVRGLPVSGSRHGQPFVRFDLDIEQIDCAGDCAAILPSTLSWSGVLRINWSGAPPLQPGQQWRLRVKAKRSRGLMNPGGFDYQTWLIERGIGGVGYVVTDADNQLLGQQRLSVDYWRWRLSEYLDSQLQPLTSRPILKALLIADKRDISRPQWELFQRHGIIHLMVISGLHIGLVAALVFGFVRILVLLLGSSAPDRPAAVAAALAALVYSVAAGGSVPTQRAFIMVATVMVMVMLRRNPLSSIGLVMAATVCLLLDPLAVASTSFWLSFSAVLALMVGLSGRIHPQRRRRALAQSQCFVFVGLLPVLAFSFGQVSIDAPIVNLLVVPVFGLMIVPCNLLALAISGVLPEWAHWLWQACDSVLALIVWVLQTADQQFAITLLALPAMPLGVIVLAAIGVLVLLLPWGMPRQAAGVVLLVPLWVYQPDTPSPGELDLAVLDVGQGLSVVIRTAGHVLVYDVGARYQQGDDQYFSMSQAALLPYLRSRGIDAVDRLVLSHSDNDHAGAWPELLQAMPIPAIYAGETIVGLRTRACNGAEGWQWEGVHFQFLATTAGASDPSNNHSCVLRVDAGEYRFLLPGDIGAGVEQALVRAGGAEELRASVLLAPHHGSRSSSSWAWLKAVRPSHVVFSTGYRNQFGHPHAVVVDRYRRVDSSLHNTSEHGMVEFRLREGKLLTPTHYRDQVKRYWL